MKNLNKVFSLLLSVFFITSCTDKESTEKYRIYYINGMSVDFMEAVEDRNVLYDALVEYREKNPEEEVLYSLNEDTVRLAYNYDEEIYTEFFEVFTQKNLDTFEFFVFLSGKMPMPDWFKDMYRSLVVQNTIQFLSNINRITDEDIRDHIDMYRKDLSDGYKIVLLGHSQGNFYANFEYDILSSESVGVVSVATPADRVGDGREHYTTFYEDAIVHAVRFMYPESYVYLPPNMHAQRCGDIDCHSFRSSYLHPANESREKIIQDIIEVIKELKRPD